MDIKLKPFDFAQAAARAGMPQVAERVRASTGAGQATPAGGADGVTVQRDIAYGTDPRLGTSVARPELRTGSGIGGPFLEYRLPRDRRRALQFLGSVSPDLFSGWLSGPPHCVAIEDEQNHLLFRSATPVSGAARQFIRAQMVNPPGGQP